MQYVALRYFGVECALVTRAVFEATESVLISSALDNIVVTKEFHDVIRAPSFRVLLSQRFSKQFHSWRSAVRTKRKSEDNAELPVDLFQKDVLLPYVTHNIQKVGTKLFCDFMMYPF